MKPRKITQRELNTLFSIAKAELVNSASRGLSPNENIARCWLLAVGTFLSLQNEYEFPFQQFPEPDDEL